MTSIPDNFSANIDYSNLRKLDLNLLVALDVLIDEASVTKAAEKLDITQSSMSHALKRLRIILGDEILIRTARKMEVTPYALELRDRVRQILVEIQATLFLKENFDPATAKGEFTIATNDYIEATIGANLLQQIITQAPGIRLRMRNLDKNIVMDTLDNNQIDLIIGAKLPLKSWHVSQDLYQEELVCVVRSDVTLTELSLDEYINRCHLLVSMRDDFQGFIDDILETQQRSRKVIWSTSHFMSLPFLIANSDCVALLPNRLAQRCAKAMGLQILPPPIAIPSATISAIWHQRNTNLASHRWLRERLVAAANNI